MKNKTIIFIAILTCLLAVVSISAQTDESKTERSIVKNTNGSTTSTVPKKQKSSTDFFDVQICIH